MKPALDFAALLGIHLIPSKSRDEWAVLLGTTGSHLTNILKGRRSVNLDLVPLWVRVLHLSKEEALRFTRLAAITHVPKQAQPALVSLVYELEHLQRLARKIKG